MKPCNALLSFSITLTGISRACLLPEEGALAATSRIDHGPSGNLVDQLRHSAPIGKGDRFHKGKIAPQGVGVAPWDKTIRTILSAQEVISGLQGLARTYDFETFTSPHTTYEKNKIIGGRVGGMGGRCNDAYHVYINANIHGRERGAADGLLYFVADLLEANRTGFPISYGKNVYTPEEVEKALSAGIVFVPLSNPDGVKHDQKKNDCWRKNRNPASAVKGNKNSIGVDVNRNFDFLWDFPNKFAPEVVKGGAIASNDAASEVFHGTAPFSEPEAKSVEWVLDTFPSVRWFVDIHSTAGTVLYSWGSDTNQHQYPDETFLNSSFDSVRGILDDVPGARGGYGEYTPTSEWNINKAAAEKMAEAMTSVRGREYHAKQSSELYATSGVSDDYAYSRHFTNPRLNLVHAFTLEFGGRSGPRRPPCPFYPSIADYNMNLKEIGAGLMNMLLAAVDLDLGPGAC